VIFWNFGKPLTCFGESSLIGCGWRIESSGLNGFCGFLIFLLNYDLNFDAKYDFYGF
jgi:hypothetical protein